MRLTPILITGIGALLSAGYLFVCSFDDDSKLGFIYLLTGGFLTVSSILVVSLEQVVVAYFIDENKFEVWTVEIILLFILVVAILRTSH